MRPKALLTVVVPLIILGGVNAGRAAGQSAQPTAADVKLFTVVAERELIGGTALSYDRHSLRNIHVVPAEHGYRIRADLSYNGGRPGWVEGEVTNGLVICLEYWNSHGLCDSPTWGRTLVDERQANRSDDQGPAQVHIQHHCPRNYHWSEYWQDCTYRGY
jgi:hypothetical protein